MAALSFFAMLADQAGHPLDMEMFDPDAMLEAMIKSFEEDEAELATEIRRLVSR